MSFILEALRKSEQERQRQAGPGFAELRPAMARPTFPVWAVALGALLAINLVVLVIVMLRRDDSPVPPLPATASSPASTQPSSNPVPANPVPLSIPGSSAPLRAELPAVERDAPDSRVALQDHPLARAEDYGIPEEPTPEELEPELQPPPRVSRASEAESDARLPTINEVTLQGGATLPDLHLDIHVYAAQPADRFVFLNNRKYREGEETPEGTKVERITRDGVVLNHHGVRFLLPRQ